MSVSPQIIHYCDHNIESTEQDVSVVKVERQENTTIDRVKLNSKVREVYCVFQKGEDNLSGEDIYYCEGIDFELLKPGSIKWIGRFPEPNDFYYVECYLITPVVEEFEDPDTCPRCYGNGWYVDLLPYTEDNVDIILGPDKVVQDFIKILYTEKTDKGYGTNLMDLLGGNVYDSTILCSEIASLIHNAAGRYKGYQSNSIAEGAELDFDEILEKITIARLEYDNDYGTVYIDILLTTLSGESRRLSALI